jgi:hypothetical protein
MKRILVATVAALAVLAVAPVASAHHANITITCEAVTFEYGGFPGGGTATSLETVSVDGGASIQKTFDFAGRSAVDTIPLNISGEADVFASYSWSSSDGDSESGEDTQHVSCGESTTGGTTTGGTTTGGTTGGGTTGSGGVIGSTTGGTTGGTAETGGELPFTGLPVWIPVLLAFALLVSGGFLLRRKRDDVS